jgi:hypothetical protein
MFLSSPFIPDRDRSTLWYNAYRGLFTRCQNGRGVKLIHEAIPHSPYVSTVWRLVKQTRLFLYFHSVDNPWYTIRTESNRRRKADKDRELPSGYLKLFYPLHIRGPLIGQTKYEHRANSWAYDTVSIYPSTSKTLFCNATLSWKERVACGCTYIQCRLNLLFSMPPAFYRLTVVWCKFRTDDRLHLAQV